MVETETPLTEKIIGCIISFTVSRGFLKYNPVVFGRITHVTKVAFAVEICRQESGMYFSKDKTHEIVTFDRVLSVCSFDEFKTIKWAPAENGWNSNSGYSIINDIDHCVLHHNYAEIDKSYSGPDFLFSVAHNHFAKINEQ